jgi:DNA adenine methylase
MPDVYASVCRPPLAGWRGIKGRFLLSLNDTPGVRDVFAAFAFDRVQTKYTCNNGDPVDAGEVLIRNF